MTKGYMFGPQTAKRVLRLTGSADGVYGPSEVVRYSGTADGGSSSVYKFTMIEDMTAGGHADTFFLDGSAEAFNVVIEDTLNDFAHLKDTEEGLCVKYDGVYYAIHPEAAAAKAMVAFELTGNLTTSGTAEVIFTTNPDIVAVTDIITVQNPTGELAFTGALGTAIMIGVSWYAIEVNRPAAFLHVTLSCNSHDWSAGDSARGFNADQVTPITVSFTKDIEPYPVNFRGTVTISNPYNFNWKTGDRALLRKESDTGDYFVIKVFRQVCSRFRFVLTANAPNGLTPNLSCTAICPTNSEDGPPPAGAVTVKDIYGLALNSKTGHKGVAEYDYNNDWYYATQAEHNAWRFRGTLNGSLSGGASFFSVTPVVAFDGKLPSGPLNVYNMHSWDTGTNGHVVSCEWNPSDGRYEAYQMRCPA